MGARAVRVLLALSWAAAAYASGVPDSPTKLEFPPLTFEPPSAEEARIELPSGVPCFVVRDSTVPAVTIQLLFRFGDFDDPPGKEGLASAAFQLLRTGGTASMTPDELAEELDSRAIDISARVEDQTSSVTVGCLTEDLGRAIEILTEMVRSPRLDPGRLELIRAQTLQRIAHRFDDPTRVAMLYADQIAYAGHPKARMTSAASVQSVTVDDIKGFLADRLQPGAMIVAVGGDLSRDDAAAALKPLLDGWESKPFTPTKVPPDVAGLPPGVYVIDMPAQQAQIIAFHHSMSSTDPKYDPDFYALRIANHALGGDFTSRLVARIRVKEGLAYSVGSYAFSNVGYPGLETFSASVDASKAVHAATAMLEEINAYRDGGATHDEVTQAKQSLFGTWIEFFDTPFKIASDYASLLASNRPLDFNAKWYAKTEAISLDEVRAAAKEYIRPGDLRWLVVGPRDSILAAQAGGESLQALGKTTELTLGDPGTAVDLSTVAR